MEKNKLFVLDTSVILYDCRSRYSFHEHDIAIPIHVLIELDNHKVGNNIINFNARDFIRFLDDLDQKLVFDGGASIGEGLGKIRVIVNSDYNEKVENIFHEKTIDHLIINTAFCLKNDPCHEYSQVILISKDVNLRMKARSLGLTAEDYEKDKVEDIESLYEGAKNLTVSVSIIDSLYKNKIINFVPDKKLNPNEFIVLNFGTKNSALAVYKNSKLHLISKEDFAPFGIKPKNSEQAFAFYGLLDPSITLFAISGNAGTGKTIISLASGLKQVDDSDYEQMLFTRTIISVGNKDLGFLPGDANEKINPYMQGLFDNLGVIKEVSQNNRKKIESFTTTEKIKIEPVSYIRGRSLSKKFFVVDEAQNLTQIEIKTIITRAGKGTKIILIGDLSQIDHPYLDERSNGFSHVMDKIAGQDFYAKITLLKGERSFMSEIVGKLL